MGPGNSYLAAFITTMCGIYAYIGKKNNATKLILHGLKRLEYRGYDSWGIAARHNSKSNFRNSGLSLKKHTGKISEAKLNSKFLNLNSTLAIGHTRWATHGGVTQTNAHPHLDCRGKIALIHNGIVENYSDLKDKLISAGHKFVSETDTEIIAHQIEAFIQMSLTFQDAVRQTFNMLSGMNAIVAINSKNYEIIAAKNGSPLIVGKADDGFYLASDASGIMPHTKTLLFVKDSEMVVLAKNIQLYSLPSGKKLKPKFETVDWNLDDAAIGSYPHFMLKEIFEQPKVIANIANTFNSQIKELASTIKKARGTFLIAAGTAYNACMTGVYLFSKIAHTHVDAAVASEFNLLEDFLTAQSLVIALSQSGETIDVLEPLQHAKQKGVPIIGITNTLGSSIYRMADKKLLLGAGPEKAVASTKAYIAKVSVFLLLAQAISGRTDKIKKQMLAAAKEIKDMIKNKNTKKLKDLAKKLSTVKHIYIIGRGASYPSALEAALKIKEVSYIHAEGLAGGELKHGTIALIDKGTPVIVFAPLDETHSAVISNATEIKARGGYIIGISPKQASIFDEWIEIKDLGYATLLTQIIPAQLLSYYLAIELGCDPDKPRNLAKAVVVK